MLITRETDYALRILRALTDGQRHTMKTLCEAEQVPQQFAYKIIKKLAQGGLVQNTRGVDGGCQLIGDLRKVSLYDLIALMEDGQQISACMRPGYKCTWKQGHNKECQMHRQVARIQKALDAELKSYDLHSMIFGKK